MKIRSHLAALAAALLLGACADAPDDRSAAGNDTAGARSRGAIEYGAAEPVASCAKGANLGGGRYYRVQFPSRVDGAAVVFTLFEPDRFDCARKHPLVLQGHGYSGSREVDKGGGAVFSPGAPVASIAAAGYAVISIDQRGHGESGGTIRVMDPEFEGQDLIAIVDWAEQHLDYLAYRGGNLLLGSTGGSYGGGYQLLLNAVDPDRRLDAMVPEITWHDLPYSLSPGGVPKSYWVLFLAGAGEANTGASQDPFIRATLLEGLSTNSFPEAATAFFNYHSPAYFCGNPLGLKVDQAGDTTAYLLDPVTSLLPVTADGQYVVKTPPLARMPKVDALLFQGTRDDLFNFNEAYKNYQCLKRGGGDVRLLSYEYGHHFLSPNTGLLVEGLNAQDVPLATQCGSIDSAAATVAWFDEKLKGQGNADSVIRSGRDICLALTVGDAVQVPQVTVGGTEFAVGLPGGLPVPVTLGNLAPVVLPLAAAGAGGEVVAGIPTASLTVSYGDPLLDGLCQGETDPVLHAGTCDTRVFVGLGMIRTSSAIPGAPELLDEQVLPLRGIGQHDVELVGVAERLAAGDQLVLLIYGAQDGFVATGAHDPAAAIVTVSGTVKVPMLGALPKLGS